MVDEIINQTAASYVMSAKTSHSYSYSPSMRLFTNIVLLLSGVAGTGFVSFFVARTVVQTATFGTCFDGGCGYAAIFLAFPLVWFVTFALYVMALLIWRKRPFRQSRSDA